MKLEKIAEIVGVNLDEYSYGVDSFFSLDGKLIRVGSSFSPHSEGIYDLGADAGIVSEEMIVNLVIATISVFEEEEVKKFLDFLENDDEEFRLRDEDENSYLFIFFLKKEFKKKVKESLLRDKLCGKI